MDVRRRWLASAKRHPAASSAPATSAATADWMHDDSAGSRMGLRGWRMVAPEPRTGSAAAPAANFELHDHSAGSGLGLRRGRLAAAGISVDSAAAFAATSGDVELPDDFSGSGLGVC